MITRAERYDYPANGQYNETVATLADSRCVTVNSQYGCVMPKGNHAATCDQINNIGGSCNCGLLAGIDILALVADARLRGMFGSRPHVETHAQRAEREAGLANYDAGYASTMRAMRD